MSIKFPSLLNLFGRDDSKDLDEYFELEDDVEAALVWLDNHPNATLEEYEAWLTHREEAIKKIKENYKE